MPKLIYTSNIPFDMSDWDKKCIKEVFAGTGCIMAITEDGETMQKIANESCMARTKYWTRISQIALSKWATGVAIGLVQDGTCMISKKPVREACENFCLNFDKINDTVKSWNNVVQVAASDAFFALHSDGTVSYVGFGQGAQKGYEEVTNWQNIKKIVTGTQCSVFGITESGEVLVAGANGNNYKNKLDEYKNVVDLYPTGSECEDVYLLTADGVVSNLNGFHSCKLFESGNVHKDKILDGNFEYKVFGLNEERMLVEVSSQEAVPVFDVNCKVKSFAVGDLDYSEPFVIAVACEN